MRVIAIDVALAMLAVVLYSPGLLHLSPFDPDVIRAAASVSGAVALIGAAGVNNAKLLSGGRERAPLRIGSGSDPSDSATFDEVYAALTDCQDDPVVGTYAFRGVDGMDEAARKSRRIRVLLDAQFEPNSLSWTRFMGVVDSVVATITRNSAILANQVQAFDTDGYERERRFIESQEYKFDDIPDDIQEERYALYNRAIASMKEILNANDRLLFELDRLVSELSGLDSGSLTTESEEMLEEIRRMVDQTRFYAE